MKPTYTEGDRIVYSEIKTLVLSLMEQYTAGGVPVADSYNGQADDLCRIPGFFNSALMAIYSRAMPETRVEALTPSRELGNIHLCLLPEDCMQVKTGGIYRLVDSRPVPTADWRPWGTYGILVDGSKGQVFAEYCPYPPALPAAPTDDRPVAVTPAVAQAAAFYCAALLLLQRDSHASTALMNEYESRVEDLGRHLRASLAPVTDVLGGMGT